MWWAEFFVIYIKINVFIYSCVWFLFIHSCAQFVFFHISGGKKRKTDDYVHFNLWSIWSVCGFDWAERSVLSCDVDARALLPAACIFCLVPFFTSSASLPCLSLCQNSCATPFSATHAISFAILCLCALLPVTCVTRTHTHTQSQGLRSWRQD